MKKILITGGAGFIGSHTCLLLLEKGYKVHGLVRRSSSFNRWRIEHLIQDLATYGKKLFLHYSDLSDDASLRRIFSKTKPDEFYHLAGQSHVGISFEIPEVTTQEIANCTVKLLEICRDQLPPPRIYLACSSEIFGNSSDSAQNEESPLNPTSPYGVAKAFCLHTGHIYRESYQLFVCNGILYNHESPRRGENFVTQKIVQGMCKIKLKKQKRLYLGNLYSKRDWGHAKDYVEMQWLMLQQENPEDYVIASGEMKSVREFIEICAKELGWEKKEGGKAIIWEKSGLDEVGKRADTEEVVVRIDPRYFRPTEVEQLLGDSSKARNQLKWKPKITLYQLIAEMIEEDSNEAKKESLLKKKGFSIYGSKE